MQISQVHAMAKAQNELHIVKRNGNKGIKRLWRDIKRREAKKRELLRVKFTQTYPTAPFKIIGTRTGRITNG